MVKIMPHTQDKKGLIVVGGGLTGLSTGLTWALNQNLKENPVLIIEKEPKTGGYVTSYEREGFLFDTCQMIPNLSDILGYLGINIDLKKFKGYYMRIFIVNPKTDEVKVIELPSGVENFKEWLIKAYPSNAEQIEKFLDYSRAMYLELFDLKVEMGIVDILKALIKCPKIVFNGTKTFHNYFSKFKINVPEVKEIFNVFAEFSALPSERVAAVVPISAMNSLLDGTFRPTKGFIELPKSIEERYKSLGGELMLNTKVVDILVEDGQVKGVKLESGEEIHSDYVVTTIDPKVAMIDMVGLETLRELNGKYAKKVEDVKMSTSSMNLSIGLDEEIDLATLGLDCGYNVITTGEDTYDRLFDAYEKGEIGFTDKRFHIGVVCPSLTTGGKPNITVRITPMALGDWQELREKDYAKYKERKQKWADFFIDKVEKYLIPNLRDHIVVLDISSPATYARYSGSPTGAIYDMAPYTDNFGRTRLKMRTPVKGLFQPKFVHGVFGCLLAGMQVNDMILDGKIMNGNARYKI
ncbi:MAG: NAD(P)/FAD-dependent oxidoreductase [Promethearchaeota archaeon]|nr:MAG: NAD(P)/FAD-dependent oxidoreductase [Candidatus Lokiarchaeota archaeon]